MAAALLPAGRYNRWGAHKVTMMRRKCPGTVTDAAMLAVQNVVSLASLTIRIAIVGLVDVLALAERLRSLAGRLPPRSTTEIRVVSCSRCLLIT